jgi:ABC-2 type transport system ATP-binding protein
MTARRPAEYNNSMPAIESFGLARDFSGRTAVEDLTLQVEAGEVLGFLGPNGAGKTTTIRMLSGMIAATRGYAEVAGFRTDKNPEEIHEHIGLLTETPGFYDRLSAERNLQFYLGFYDRADGAAAIEKYLKKVGLWERRADKVGTYSKGMKQRLALTRAMLHEPEVLFLDEPTAGLDPEAAGEVRELIRGLSGEGRTIFLSTHNLNEAEILCRRIAVIHTRLLAIDTAESLRRRFFRRQVIVQLEEADARVTEAAGKLPFVRDIRAEGSRLVLELADSEKNRPELVKTIVETGGRVVEVTEKQYPLEDVYLKLLHEGEGNDAPAP